MPCLVALLALATPRLAIVLLWLLSSWFQGVFSTALWPLLGFFLAPTTLIWYSVVQRWFDGEWTLWPVAGLVAALLADGVPARLGLGKRK